MIDRNIDERERQMVDYINERQTDRQADRQIDTVFKLIQKPEQFTLEKCMLNQYQNQN